MNGARELFLYARGLQTLSLKLYAKPNKSIKPPQKIQIRKLVMWTSLKKLLCFKTYQDKKDNLQNV